MTLDRVLQESRFLFGFIKLGRFYLLIKKDERELSKLSSRLPHLSQWSGYIFRTQFYILVYNEEEEGADVASKNSVFTNATSGRELGRGTT